MPFNLFHKKKPEEQQAPAAPTQETQPIAEPQTPPEAPKEQPPEATPATPIEEPIATPAPAPVEEPVPVQAQPEPQPAAEPQPTLEPVAEEKKEAPIEAPSKTYLKAMPLKDLADLENVKTEVMNGNIIILKITPLAQKSIEDVKTAVNDLYQFAENIGGDIARLGEERVVICPKTVRIWREKTPKPIVSNGPLPSAA